MSRDKHRTERKRQREDRMRKTDEAKEAADHFRGRILSSKSSTKPSSTRKSTSFQVPWAL